jgi:hypothetical protein
VADYVLETVDLDVFGGPTSLDVSTDFGRAGTRGTRVWVGTGAPEITLTTQDIALYDLYINTNTVDQYYSWLYQYVPEVSWKLYLALDFDCSNVWSRDGKADIDWILFNSVFLVHNLLRLNLLRQDEAQQKVFIITQKSQAMRRGTEPYISCKYRLSYEQESFITSVFLPLLQ